jgi:hypothetical protein
LWVLPCLEERDDHEGRSGDEMLEGKQPILARRLLGLALYLPPACGPVDLDDGDASLGEEAGQAGAVGAGALHTGLGELAVAAGPGHQLLVAGPGRGDGQPALQTAEVVQQDGDVDLGVVSTPRMTWPG